jgi:hypothetical protein
MRLACLPCARAKQGCDALRPCSRCIKKGTPEQCQDKQGRVSAQVPVQLATPVPPITDTEQQTPLPAIPVSTPNTAKRKHQDNTDLLHPLNKRLKHEEQDELIDPPLSSEQQPQDELMPLSLVSLIPREPDLTPTFSVYHLLYQQPPSDAYGRILQTIIDNTSPMTLEDFIVRSGKWYILLVIHDQSIDANLL